ncbi:MAG: bifunctional oligoribonuclease/PAP phosphatase NrnA [Firmicutes bacterium]|nr:bifunctional oligoribonuclease/PAP phosphatase NrnA [Bacillota bacterium]
MTLAEFAPQFAAFAEKYDQFIICGHIRPDGDSIGSCITIAERLRLMGKHPRIYYEGDLSHYPWLTQPVEILDEKTLSRATCCRFGWIMVDCAEPARTGEAAVCADLAETSVCIDHHTNMGEYADYNLIDPGATSASEIIFRLFKALDYPFNPTMATALFTGIAFDTGGFRHSSMKPEIFGILQELSKQDVPITRVMNGLFHTKSMLEMKVLSVIMRKARLYHGRIIVSWLENSDFLKLGATSDDCEGAVADLAEVEEAEAAVFLRELPNGQVRVNMRSKHFINVAAAAKAFGGGGHVRAAGCTLSGPMLLAREAVISELAKQLPEDF